MVKPLYYCFLLPVTLLAALCTDPNKDFKFVCIGTSIEVFQNVTSTFLKSEYTLYKIFGEQSETIATWILQNFSTNPIIHPKYSQKVSLENGTILLQDFQASDETTYRMLYDNSSKNKQIQLCALVPPTLRCKPNIKYEENFLIASLDNHEYCGKPLVSVRWMEQPGISYISKSRIELPPGNQGGTYRACIEGEALTCVKNTSERDYCDYITIGSKRETIVPTISETPHWKIDTIVGVTIVSLVLLLVVLTHLIKQFWKKCGIGSKSAPDVNGSANLQLTRRNDGVGAEGEQARQEGEPLVSRDDIPMQDL